MILSIGDVLLDNRQSIIDIMNMIPDKQLVLETDISTVSIVEIYKAASKAKQMTLQDITFSIEQTIHSIYGHI
jgi:Tat protein secretion system quality control protein TatD with DNase activity